MNVTALARIGVVVNDLDQAMEEYARLLGIDHWTINEYDESRLSDTVSHGRRSAGGYRSARGETSLAGRVPFELVQPTTGETPFKEFLLTKGEGICWISVSVEGEDDRSVAKHFKKIGIAQAHSHVVDGGHRRTFFDTRKQLGGYLVEFQPAGEVPGDREVTLDGAALRGGGDPIPMERIYHFGVLVDDVMETLPYYRDIFGPRSFDMKTWQHEFGRLDDPMYRGEKKSTGYFTAQAPVADFGFEIIQVNYGDCHYNREFTDQRGSGIHHVFGWMTRDQAEWEAVCGRAAELGAPLCMGSDLRGGAAEFGYWDTFMSLKGYLFEGVVRRRQPEDRFASPDWKVDFDTVEKDGIL